MNESLDFGGERQSLVGARVIKRLDAEKIACEQQQLAVAVQQSKGKHSHKTLKRLHSPLAIGSQQHLRIGAAAKLMSELLEFTAQLEVVVDLAVVDDMQAAVCSAHWLPAGLAQIQDRKPAVNQDQFRIASGGGPPLHALRFTVAVEKVSIVVGAAMPQ